MLDFKFTIPYYAGDANNLFKKLKNVLKLKSKSSANFSFNNLFGIGLGITREIEDGLKVTYVEVKPNISFRLNRKATEENTSFTLFYVLSDNAPEFNFDTEDKDVNDFNFSGGLLLSSTVKGYFNVYAKQKLKITGITFSKKWALKNLKLGESESISNQILESSEPFSFFEMRDKKLENIYSEFSEIFTEEVVESSFFIKSKVYEFIGWFIEQSKRENKSLAELISSSKNQKVLKVKRILKNNMLEPCPSILELSTKIAMSESALKKEFKKQVGTGIYTYHLNLKIDYSKKLLMNLDSTVAEIGYYIGYANASKFSKAFFNRTGKTPIEWRKENTKE